MASLLSSTKDFIFGSKDIKKEVVKKEAVEEKMKPKNKRSFEEKLNDPSAIEVPSSKKMKTVDQEKLMTLMTSIEALENKIEKEEYEKLKKNINLREIVVFGDTSAGKSTLIMSILEVDKLLPVDAGTCTMFPTKVMIMHNDDQSSMYQISDQDQKEHITNDSTEADRILKSLFKSRTDPDYHKTVTVKLVQNTKKRFVIMDTPGFTSTSNNSQNVLHVLDKMGDYVPILPIKFNITDIGTCFTTHLLYTNNYVLKGKLIIPITGIDILINALKEASEDAKIRIIDTFKSGLKKISDFVNGPVDFFLVQSGSIKPNATASEISQEETENLNKLHSFGLGLIPNVSGYGMKQLNKAIIDRYLDTYDNEWVENLRSLIDTNIFDKEKELNSLEHCGKINETISSYGEILINRDTVLHFKRDLISTQIKAKFLNYINTWETPRPVSEYEGEIYGLTKAAIACKKIEYVQNFVQKGIKSLEEIVPDLVKAILMIYQKILTWGTTDCNLPESIKQKIYTCYTQESRKYQQATKQAFVTTINNCSRMFEFRNLNEEENLENQEPFSLAQKLFACVEDKLTDILTMDATMNFVVALSQTIIDMLHKLQKEEWMAGNHQSIVKAKSAFDQLELVRKNIDFLMA